MRSVLTRRWRIWRGWSYASPPVASVRPVYALGTKARLYRISAHYDPAEPELGNYYHGAG